jgi:hypothetical protein
MTAGTTVTVLTPDSTQTDAVKDPVVVRRGDEYVMFVVSAGWDRYQTRLGRGRSRGGGFLGLDDGSRGREEDTEERLGVARSRDLRRWERLCVEAPWLSSPRASGSLRYADALERDGEWWVYYEYAAPAARTSCA